MQVKKLYDLEKTRRVKCRHFNGTIPSGCPRIFCTNSGIQEYYPAMTNKHDRTGIMRRQLFQVVLHDTRLCSRPSTTEAQVQLPIARTDASDWRLLLARVCGEAAVGSHTEAALAAAAHLGVALCEELVEVGDDIASIVSMKALERKRFLAQLRV